MMQNTGGAKAPQPYPKIHLVSFTSSCHSATLLSFFLTASLALSIGNQKLT